MRSVRARLARLWETKLEGQPDHLQAYAEAVDHYEQGLPIMLGPVQRPIIQMIEEEELPIGSITAFGGVAPPAKWLECNGDLLAGGNYPDLEAVLGSTWNKAGDAAGAVRLPDLRGRAPVGAGVDPLGDYFGSRKVTLLESEIPVHKHNLDSQILSRQRVPDGTLNLVSTELPAYDIGAVPETQLSGGGESHENIQPSAAVMMIIRAE